jgi:hypothetical protein
MTTPADTPDPPDGWLVPPVWLETNSLTPEEFDALKARYLAACHGPVVVLPPDPPLWRRWWEWPAVQWWWYRQYKRADRRAFKRECRDIRWREAWKGER